MNFLYNKCLCKNWFLSYLLLLVYIILFSIILKLMGIKIHPRLITITPLAFTKENLAAVVH